MSFEIHTYGENPARGHNVAVDLDGTRVLITSEGPAHDEHVQRLAGQIASGFAAQRELEAERERLREQLTQLRREVSTARASLAAAVTGRRRFFSAVHCVPAEPGKWDGPVWLLDPVKGEGGFGLVFSSLAEVRQLHPELWITGMTDRGILLDAYAMPGAAKHALEAMERMPPAPELAAALEASAHTLSCGWCMSDVVVSEDSGRVRCDECRWTFKVDKTHPAGLVLRDGQPPGSRESIDTD